MASAGSSPPHTEIPAQIRLPLRVALSLVRQGIRIRLGRSFVTLSGVALGIAFVMSTLTAESLRRGMAEEDRFRDQASRMFAELVAETGPLAGRVLGVVVSGTVSPSEARLLGRLVEESPKELRSYGSEVAWREAIPGAVSTRVFRDPLALAHGASALIVLGAGPAPELPWPEMLRRARQPILAYAGDRATSAPAGGKLVRLARAPEAGERAHAAAEARRADFRTRWILAISLLVTLIGIANAMLMSVSERFRDIGTMKCLGALSSFVRSMFLIESAFLGAAGGLFGALGGFAFTVLSFLVPYDAALVGTALAQELGSLTTRAALSATGGVVLSTLAAFYPAELAARMVPANALRSNV